MRPAFAYIDPSWLDTLSPGERQELDRRRRLALVRANKPVTTIYLVLFGALLYLTPYGHENIRMAMFLAALMVPLTLLRHHMARLIEKRDANVPEWDHQLFRATCLSNAVIWSWFTFSALTQYQTSWIGFLVVIFLSAIANSAMTVLAADVRLAAMYTIIVAASPIAWTLTSKSSAGSFIAIVTLLYTCLLILFARQRNHLILGGIRDKMRLETQATELRRAKEQAEAAAVAKTQFLAAMSHEIRTPLSGVLGLLNLLSETRLDNHQRDLTKAIEQSGDMLLTIVNDILDYSKIGSGKLALENTPFNIREALAAVVGPMRKTCANNGVSIVFHVSPDVPGWVRGDPTRVKQVMNNLLSNAIKFTKSGSIRILVHTPTPGRVRFAVRDTGIGISKDVQERLFDEFSQADQSTARRFGGTGLGLAICQRLVETMGGKIGLESALNQGSLFWFEVSLPEAPPKQLPPPPAPRPEVVEKRKLTVLLAEDNPVNQRVLAHLVRKMGHEVTLAGNGLQAVEEFRKNHFDMILMDCHMPEIDGFEATRIIRSMGGERAAIPIVAVTANAFAEDRIRCLAAGMNDHVSKPVQIATLERAMLRMMSILNVCGPEGASRSSESPSSPARPDPVAAFQAPPPAPKSPVSASSASPGAA